LFLANTYFSDYSIDVKIRPFAGVFVWLPVSFNRILIIKNPSAIIQWGGIDVIKYVNVINV